jgi:hypothetical protein
MVLGDKISCGLLGLSTFNAYGAHRCNNVLQRYEIYAELVKVEAILLGK